MVLLNKICRCGKVIPTSIARCDECQVRYEIDRARRDKEYDLSKRNKRSEAFYNSPEWESLREYILNKYKNLDLYDYFINKKITYANTIHHVLELNEDWNRRLDSTNLFPLSDKNHNKIHGMYKRNKNKTQRLLFDLIEKWNQKFN